MNRSNFHFIFVFILLFCGSQNSRGGDVPLGDGAGNRILTSLRLKFEIFSQMLLSSNPSQFSNREEESSVIPFSDDDFVEIASKGASFMMGSPGDEKVRLTGEGGMDGEQVKVRFDYSFAMMKTEVTQKHWPSFTSGKRPSYFGKKKYCPEDYDRKLKICPNHPVEKVSWKMIKRFIGSLNEKAGLEGCDKRPEEAVGCYRLPTEAEWEFAARGGTQTAYFFGDDPNDLGIYGWYFDNSDEQTHGVGLKPENAFGLFDMHGNVWEWVEDKYRNFMPGGDNPLVTTGIGRIVRGGSWFSYAIYLRSGYCHHGLPELGYRNVGFRLVKTL